MIDALVTGILVNKPVTTTRKDGELETTFTLRANLENGETALVNGVCCGKVADRLGRYRSGDSLAVNGALRPAPRNSEVSEEPRHTLVVNVRGILTPYDCWKAAD